MSHFKTIFMIVLFIAAATGQVHADIIYESAIMNQPGDGGGLSVTDQFLGSRFHIDFPVQVTGIGGHLVGGADQT